MAIAASLGVDLLRNKPATTVELDAPSGPSIIDISAQIPKPVAGGDTMAASRAMMAAMQGAATQ
jgi:hypothetical protein